jgi:hypothetical protein
MKIIFYQVNTTSKIALTISILSLFYSFTVISIYWISTMEVESTKIFFLLFLSILNAFYIYEFLAGQEMSISFARSTHNCEVGNILARWFLFLTCSISCISLPFIANYISQ